MATGIYKITNKITGDFYIGQSTNIKTRFSQHRSLNKTPKSELNKAIVKYGKENFTYEIVEMCSKEKLLEREAYYIKELQPTYNYIGLTNNTKFKSLISKATKQWWKNLDEETKKKIISNNLTGQPKGHKVSEGTRKKISEKVSNKVGNQVMIVETGEVFKQVRLLEKKLGACTGTVNAYWSGKIKTVKGYHVVKV